MNRLTVETIAAMTHAANRAYSMSLGEASQSWEECSEGIRASVISGVRKVIDDPTITPEKLHEEWCAFKQNQGWVYGPVKDESIKQHPCLVPYTELPVEQRVKDALFRSIILAVIPLYLLSNGRMG